MERKELVCPTKIGPYQLKGTIGIGAYATVKLAYRLDTQQYFACKIIGKKRISSPHQRRCFESEIRVQQQLHHPNVLAVCDLFKDTINYYVILEFCPNGDLFSLIVQNKKFPIDMVSFYFKQILNGVAYIHKMNVAHRDLKPENILLDASGNAKISDFGLSKFCGGSELTSTSCGSPCYASPEVLSGTPYNPKLADLWSLGIILFTMLTGHLPWTKKNKIQLFEQIKNAEFTIPVSLPKDVTNLLQSLLKPQPNQRITAESALKHEFFDREVDDTPTSKKIPDYYVSLRKVDEFFEVEKEQMMPLRTGNFFFQSTSEIQQSFARTSKLISGEDTHPKSAPSTQASSKVKVSPSNNTIAKFVSKPEIQINIHDLLRQGNKSRLKYSTRVKISRPDLKKASTSRPIFA